MAKSYKSISSENNAKAKALGLPTSPDQIFPDVRDGDRLQNTSPYDIDDRLFTNSVPTPEQIRNEYLIGFISNSREMTQPMIRRALKACLNWMETHDKVENLNSLKTVIDDL
ncbi:MAG TPA: hypothetical protein VFM18_00295 [Methanosarcina sp.]|nr:hypothetical protein [Methanosarcina sp.]